MLAGSSGVPATCLHVCHACRAPACLLPGLPITCLQQCQACRALACLLPGLPTTCLQLCQACRAPACLLPGLPITRLHECPAYPADASMLPWFAKRLQALWQVYHAPDAILAEPPPWQGYSTIDVGIGGPANTLVQGYAHPWAGFGGTLSNLQLCTGRVVTNVPPRWLLPAPGQPPATAHTAMAELPTGP